MSDKSENTEMEGHLAVLLFQFEFERQSEIRFSKQHRWESNGYCQLSSFFYCSSFRRDYENFVKQTTVGPLKGSLSEALLSNEAHTSTFIVKITLANTT